MKSTSLVVALLVSSSLAVAGCDQIKKMVGGKPSGQVIATVNGEEITSLELRQELGGFSSRDPKVMKAAQQQALQQIVMRDILADKAKEQKLDKSTDYTLQLRRGQQTLLSQLYERKIASKVATPTKTDAQAFVASHPDQFAGRRILSVDQLIAPMNKVTPEQLRPLHTLEDVKTLFNTQGVPYQENSSSLDTLTADPRLVQQIARLPAAEVFVVPQGGALVFNHVSGSRSAPFTGDLATNYAMNFLRQQSAQEAVTKQVVADRKAAEAKIVYSAGYKPDTPKPAAPAKPGATPAAAAPAAAAPAAK